MQKPERDIKYIGYSNSKKKWILIEPQHVRADTYEFLNSGATSWVYVRKDNSKVVKIIRGSKFIPEHTFIAKAEREIEYQKAAAKAGLAPKIYHHCFIEKKDSFYDTKEPYYYIEMDNLSEATGWKPIFAVQAPQLFCKFIRDLVVKVGIINIEDPQLHFFSNGSELRMIDYDRCTDATGTGTAGTGTGTAGTDKEIGIAKMAKALGITCPLPKTGGKKTKLKKTKLKKTKLKKTKLKKTIKKRKSRKYTIKKK